jgi:hypothetical protein
MAPEQAHWLAGWPASRTRAIAGQRMARTMRSMCRSGGYAQLTGSMPGIRLASTDGAGWPVKRSSWR